MTTAFAGEAHAVAHLIVEDLGTDLTVEGAHGHHLARVRRLRPGERMTAADGVGTWRAYEVATSAKGRVTLVAIGEPVTEPVRLPRIELVFAPTKGGQPERVVQHATELGVAGIHPLVTERTVVRWDDVRGADVLERFRRVALEAACQSFRASLPVIGEPLTVDDLATRDGVIVADRGGPKRPEMPAGEVWWVGIGPEGGFTPEEASRLRRKQCLGLGDQVLRTETAALAACTILATLRDI